MKRLLCVILTILFCAIPSTAFCSEVVYEIPELYMTVAIPEEYTVFTQEVQKDDSRLKSFGLDFDYLMETFEQKDIFLKKIV